MEHLKPRLRFDKVALRLIDRLRAAVVPIAPEGTVVMIAVAAPIRLASKTADAIERKIRNLLSLESKERDKKLTVHGNRVRIRLLRDKSKRAASLIGFVHNPDSGPLELFEMTSELLKAMRRPNPARGRRILVQSGRESSYLDIYRWIYSQAAPGPGFENSLIEFCDGRSETLNE